MASTRYQIRIPDRMAAVLGDVAENEISGRIADVLDRYQHIIGEAQQRLLAQLSPLDQAMIRAACQSWATRTTPARILVGGIVAELEDAAEDGGDLSSIDPVNVEALVSRIAALSSADQIALIEWLERQ
ncbi:hypothetical protein N8I74_11025 [Chitiniphilus purpureus]|uniref:Uncharacterized protein n=1 Tax=Chitiniphilus purpureus TaxID=2981137 RepID=A0ABY6DHN5_9NEIS|nr:hypothetical protein [Chitiniphilus sp. CD1]UXY13854.1 hypothetical protein N8I74_11025 [Chitiniphilus sp. CD1]